MFFAILGCVVLQIVQSNASSNVTWKIDDQGLLQELNVSIPSGSRRLVWGEKGRFGPAWVNHYPHSSSTGQGWQIFLPNGTFLQISGHDIETATVNQDTQSASIRSSAWVGNVTDSWFIVPADNGDDDTLVASIEWNATFTASAALRQAVEEASRTTASTGTSSSDAVDVPYPLLPGQATVNIPFNLGALRMGNQGADGSGPLDLKDSRMFQLWGDKGGVLQGGFNQTGHTVEYPVSIGAFAPLAALGEWTQDGMVVALQATEDVDHPESIGSWQYPRGQFTPGFVANCTLLIGAQPSSHPASGPSGGGSLPPSPSSSSPRWSATRRMAIGIARASDWKSAVSPYVKAFRARHGAPGPWSPSRPGPPLIPRYCPQTGPLMYFVGSNDMPAYNHSSHRYIPGNKTNLADIFAQETGPQAMSAIGISGFGVWATALNSQYLTQDGSPCEFNPDIDILDPALPAGYNRSRIDDLAAAYSRQGMDLFHFARPCLEIVGASVQYGPSPGSFNVSSKGFCRPADLRDPATASRQLQRLEGLLDRGVRGFYLDAMSCPGDTAFLQRVRERHPGLFLVKEGCRDRDALQWPQIPILKLPYFPENNSVLLTLVTPLASAYGGAIDRNLEDEEFRQVLAAPRRYLGFVQNYPLHEGAAPKQDVCDYTAQSIKNQWWRYEQYGEDEGCPRPAHGGVPPPCGGGVGS